MCRDCGCGDPELVPVEVQTKILAGNDRMAVHNREHLEQAGILTINLMGSPGAGKTAVLERTAAAFAGRFRIAAITGDLATDNDAARLERAGIPSRAITTGTACHLDARQIHDALHDVDWNDLGVLFIENVGNLVCPAVYDLGQAFNVVALSITEGEDKPIKYPTMFHKADLVLLTKLDLAPHLDISLDEIRRSLSCVMPDPVCYPLSAKSGDGFEAWIRWIEEKKSALDASRSVAAAPAPHHHHHSHEHDHEA
jgi:hydrogenase nickel incorporation protein HypB